MFVKLLSFTTRQKFHINKKQKIPLELIYLTSSIDENLIEEKSVGYLNLECEFCHGKHCRATSRSKIFELLS